MAVPRVSVITPTYNHEAHIGQCITSVLKQTFPDWEMIIIDDASTDRTMEIAKSCKDPRVRIIENPKNLGISCLAQNYNKALEASQGEFIAILEGDDFWPEKKLQIQVPDFEDPQVVLSWGRAMMTMPDGAERAIAPPNLPPEDARVNKPVGRAAFRMMSNKYLTFVFSSTCVMRKQALIANRGFRQAAYTNFVDQPTFMGMALLGPWSFHDTVLGYWRRHPASETKSTFPWMISASYRYASEFLDNHASKVPANSKEWAELDQEWRVFDANRCLLVGRILASRKRGPDAAPFFEAVKQYGLGRKWDMAAGMAASAARANLPVEPILKGLLKVPPIDSQYRPGGFDDPHVSPEMRPLDFKRYDLARFG